MRIDQNQLFERLRRTTLGNTAIKQSIADEGELLPTLALSRIAEDWAQAIGTQVDRDDGLSVLSVLEDGLRQGTDDVRNIIGTGFVEWLSDFPETDRIKSVLPTLLRKSLEDYGV